MFSSLYVGGIGLKVRIVSNEFTRTKRQTKLESTLFQKIAKHPKSQIKQPSIKGFACNGIECPHYTVFLMMEKRFKVH
jgi:hypothetical protein